ncbi:DUF423 domain-containing protein [Kushneria marisflavi]|uniref:Uncharacterized protein n=1 Tax=Kushneria marisflavi TaxID=157779 RepID=A0A240UN77_9GAMM|nr:DUF423 domain-containing protein [Kushneria marisflavi]ART62944.1 hypothetical protein B9H00_07650 [Kushneria marisflavi]RKD84831.1 uncharacterized membrane protein YgdD (TMEM256/DUF423 family) [Kushneria marisflavi]
MPSRLLWLAVALSGLGVVILGAWGAHGLADRLDAQALNAWHTGVRYQAWHTLAFMMILIWREVVPLVGQRFVLGLWGIGVVLFSGSLYLLALGGPALLGPITPLGGLAMMAGWAMLGVTALRRRPEPS